jgi:hypothetical protein
VNSILYASMRVPVFLLHVSRQTCISLRKSLLGQWKMRLSLQKKTGNSKIQQESQEENLRGTAAKVHSAKQGIRIQSRVGVEAAKRAAYPHPASSHFCPLCPKSNPRRGSDLVPLTLTGTSVPAPSLLKKGSTGFNRTEFPTRHRHSSSPFSRAARCFLFKRLQPYPVNRLGTFGNGSTFTTLY